MGRGRGEAAPLSHLYGQCTTTGKAGNINSAQRSAPSFIKKGPQGAEQQPKLALNTHDDQHTNRPFSAAIQANDARSSRVHLARAVFESIHCKKARLKRCLSPVVCCQALGCFVRGSTNEAHLPREARAEVSKRCWGGREWQGCNSLAAAQTS